MRCGWPGCKQLEGPPSKAVLVTRGSGFVEGGGDLGQLVREVTAIAELLVVDLAITLVTARMSSTPSMGRAKGTVNGS